MTEWLNWICISALWGQCPVFFTFQVPQCCLMAAGSQVLFSFLVALRVQKVTDDCDPLVYWYGMTTPFLPVQPHEEPSHPAGELGDQRDRQEWRKPTEWWRGIRLARNVGNARVWRVSACDVWCVTGGPQEAKDLGEMNYETTAFLEQAEQ